MEKARQTIVLVDDASKLKENLGGVLPVVIEGGDKWEEAAEAREQLSGGSRAAARGPAGIHAPAASAPPQEIDTMLLGEAEVWRRAAEGAATSDPRATSNPYVTEARSALRGTAALLPTAPLRPQHRHCACRTGSTSWM